MTTTTKTTTKTNTKAKAVKTPTPVVHTVVKSSKYLDFTLSFTGTITVNDRVMDGAEATDYLAKTLALQLNRSTSKIPTVEARQKHVAEAMAEIIQTGYFQTPSNGGSNAAVATRVFLALIESVDGEQEAKDKIIKKHSILDAKISYLTTACLTDLPTVQDVIASLGIDRPADLSATLTLIAKKA